MFKIMSSLLRSLIPALFCWVANVAPAIAADRIAIPGFWDQKRRIDRPNTPQLRMIRFLTEDDFPPFHFIGPDGTLTGFEVELARAICEQLKVACSIQPRRWDGLADALAQGTGDAIIAAMKITPESRTRFAFTGSYFRSPARFVGKKDLDLKDISAAALAGRKIAVVQGSAHEAYLKAFFPQATVSSGSDSTAVLDMVRFGAASLGFVDGVATTFWLNGETSQNCCALVGGPYTESRFFGEGSGIAVRRDNPQLLQALDWALQRLASEGIYDALYLKYFPISLY